MKRLIEFFINNKKFTIVVTMFIIAFGYLGFTNVKNEQFPSVNFAIAIVVTNYPGASPEEVEVKVTRPIEDEIKTVKGLKDVKSESDTGLSLITIRVDMDNEDTEEVMNDLQKAVERVTDLPQGLPNRPKFTELNSEEFPALQIAVLGSNENRKRDEIVEFISDELEDMKGIAEVVKQGYREREFSVGLKKDKLQDYNIGISEVLNVLKQRNINTPAGHFSGREGQATVRLDAKVSSVEELKKIAIRADFSGPIIYLSDIAKVKDGMKKPTKLVRYNGEDATTLVINKKAGTDTIKLVQDIKDRLKILKKKIPKEFTLKVYQDESEEVLNRFNVLKSNAFSGLFLVIFFLLLFLPGKIGMMASLSLPLSMMAIVGMLPLYDINFNAVSILAMVIALGMLVDNSVVISENFSRLKEEGVSNFEAAVSAANQFWLPITATVLTTIAAFLPMLVTKGIMGLFIKSIPIIVTMSLLISLVESFFLLPMRLNFIGQYVKFKIGSDGKIKGSWFKKVSSKFENFMSVCVRFRYIVLACFTILITFSFYMVFVVNKFILFPAEQTKSYFVRFELEQGDSIEKTHDVSRRLSKDIMDAIGNNVKSIVAQVGSSKGLMDFKGRKGDHVGLMTVFVTDETKKNVPHTVILEKLRKISTDYVSEVQYEAEVNGPPVGDAVNLNLRSTNDDSLKKTVIKMMNYLKTIDGLTDLKVNEVIGKDEIHVNLNYEKVSRMGLDVNTIGQTIKMALEGLEVTKINQRNHKFDLKLQLLDDYKENLEDLKNIMISDRMGNLIPLHKLGTFERTKGTPVIKRFDFQRAKNITAGVNEDKITSIGANILIKKFFENVQKEYPEVTMIYGGQEENTQESMDSLMEAEILALIGIFAILVLIFGSFLRPAIIMSTIPLGFIGFGIAFYFHERPVSFLALIGIVGLTGIIVNSGIVLISFIDQMVKEGKLELHEVLVKASGMRLRAVLVTSLTTVGGLFPTAYGVGGEDPMLVPMTLSMAWGLTSGTILTLVWVPCAYGIQEDMTSFLSNLKGKIGRVLHER